AVTFIIDGNLARIPAVGLVSIRNGGAILLFAFTYLWVAYNQYANAGGRGLGWYSAFVAVTAIVFGVYTVQNTPGSNTADLLLAGPRPPRRRAARAPAVWVMAPYLVPPALFVAGLLLHATWLVLGGVVLCPFIPVLTWLLIRRHLIHRVPSHRREP